MPEGTRPPTEGIDDEPVPLFIPEGKHDAGLRISKIGRQGRRRMRAEARHDKRIARLNKQLNDAKKNKSADLAMIDADAALPANELMGFIRGSWPKLTRNGMTKLVRFFSGVVEIRNLPDRAVVTDESAFMEEARRKGRARLLITRGKDKPNLSALNEDLPYASTFRSVVIERRSSLTIRPKFGWGLLRTYLPRKMHDTAKIDELLGDEPLEWKLEPPKRDD